jgi:hypothetical protein
MLLLEWIEKLFSFVSFREIGVKANHSEELIVILVVILVKQCEHVFPNQEKARVVNEDLRQDYLLAWKYEVANEDYEEEDVIYIHFVNAREK